MERIKDFFLRKRSYSISGKSSNFVSAGAIAGYGLIALICKLSGVQAGCLCFTLLFAVFLFCRLWGMLSIRRIELDMKADRYAVFPGQELPVKLSVKNNKLFPVMWAEIAQVFESDACLMPDGTEELTGYEMALEGYVSGSCSAYRRKFSLILGMESFEHECSWKAKRRGIYRPQSVLLRSGDGFGIAQFEMQAALKDERIFAVYPALQPVNTAMFMKNVNDSSRNGRGYIEDPSLIKSTRAYQPGDPYKKINMRLMAMGLPVEVNIQETIFPKNAHFILDGESFTASSNERDVQFFEERREAAEQLEDALSVIASLIMSLEGAGVRCGLSLPMGEECSAVTVSAFSEHAPLELLFRLSAYSRMKPVLGEDGHFVIGRPSSFNKPALSASVTKGEKMYIFTKNEDIHFSRALRRAYEAGAVVITCDECARYINIDRIRRDGYA